MKIQVYGFSLIENVLAIAILGIFGLSLFIAQKQVFIDVEAAKKKFEFIIDLNNIATDIYIQIKKNKFEKKDPDSFKIEKHIEVDFSEELKAEVQEKNIKSLESFKNLKSIKVYINTKKNPKLEVILYAFIAREPEEEKKETDKKTDTSKVINNKKVEDSAKKRN